jgi:hypothetical protein
MSENDKYILLPTNDLIGDYFELKFKEKEEYDLSIIC